MQPQVNARLTKRFRTRYPENWGEEIWVKPKHDEWKREKNRPCHLASHGGRQFCTGEENIVLGWYNFIWEVKYVQDAESDCEQLGGTIFEDVCSDYSKDLLETFNRILESPDCFWLGVLYDIEIPSWRTLSGNPVSLSCVSWGKGQPIMDNDDEILAAAKVDLDTREFQFMNSVSQSRLCTVVCSRDVVYAG